MRGHGRQPRISSALRRALAELEEDSKTKPLPHRMAEAGIPPAEGSAFGDAMTNSILIDEALRMAMESFTRALEIEDTGEEAAEAKATAQKFYALSEERLTEEEMVVILQFCTTAAMVAFTNGLTVGVQYAINTLEGGQTRRQNRPGR